MAGDVSDETLRSLEREGDGTQPESRFARRERPEPVAGYVAPLEQVDHVPDDEPDRTPR